VRVIDFWGGSTVPAFIAEWCFYNGCEVYVTLKKNVQRANACGYVSAKNAALLRAAGHDWKTCPVVQSCQQQFIKTGNEMLQKKKKNMSYADWLTGDEVLNLANKFAETEADKEGRWLAGPMPVNHFIDGFRNLLETGKDMPMVVYVVNTAEQYNLEGEHAGWLSHYFASLSFNWRCFIVTQTFTDHACCLCFRPALVRGRSLCEL
jgi:hypothetical protein